MKICLFCGGKNSTSGRYCNTCYAYLRRHPNGTYEKPKEGEVKYAPNGDPICHICGQAHRRLGSHIKQKHHLTQSEYRDKFKLYRNTKLSNDEYISKMSQYNNTYKEVVVNKNLIECGKKTRTTKEYNTPNKRKYGRPIISTYI